MNEWRDPMTRICQRPGCGHPLYQHAFHPHHKGPPHECLVGAVPDSTDPVENLPTRCGCPDFVDPGPPPDADTPK